MTKINLAGHKRTILKARIRRHPDLSEVISQLGFGSADVAQWTVAALFSVAAVLKIPVPDDNASHAYTAARNAGLTHAEAMAQADDMQGLTGQPMTLGDEAPDTDEETPNPQTKPATPVEADPMETDAKAAVAAVLKPMGAGDMVGFQQALHSLALKAVTPPPVAAPVQAYFDPSKVKGHCPTIVARKSMMDVQIKANLTARADATCLDVYDAPDAPAIDPTYTWPDDFTAPVLAALSRGRNVFLHGPAGTGKTTFAEQIAARWTRPFVRINCDDQTEAATLVGMTVPDGQGGVKWQDGQLSSAIRRPGTVILIDEPSVARPGALMVLQAVLDGARALSIQETGERVPVAPGVLILCADNTNGTGDNLGAYEGTRVLNRAFLDRFALTVHFQYMGAIAEAQVITARTHLRPNHALEIAKFAAMTRAAATKGDVSHGLGIRRLFALAEQIADGVPPAIAFQGSVIATAPAEDQEHLRQMWASHVSAKTFA